MSRYHRRPSNDPYDRPVSPIGGRYETREIRPDGRTGHRDQESLRRHGGIGGGSVPVGHSAEARSSRSDGRPTRSNRSRRPREEDVPVFQPGPERVPTHIERRPTFDRLYDLGRSASLHSGSTPPPRHAEPVRTNLGRSGSTRRPSARSGSPYRPGEVVDLGSMGGGYDPDPFNRTRVPGPSPFQDQYDAFDAHARPPPRYREPQGPPPSRSGYSSRVVEPSGYPSSSSRSQRTPYSRGQRPGDNPFWYL
jgi:hypothetical protein